MGGLQILVVSFLMLLYSIFNFYMFTLPFCFVYFNFFLNLDPPSPYVSGIAWTGLFSCPQGSTYHFPSEPVFLPLLPQMDVLNLSSPSSPNEPKDCPRELFQIFLYISIFIYFFYILFLKEFVPFY